jgi:hypothetical protein
MMGQSHPFLNLIVVEGLNVKGFNPCFLRRRRLGVRQFFTAAFPGAPSNDEGPTRVACTSILPFAGCRRNARATNPRTINGKNI